MDQDESKILEEFFYILHKTAMMKGISEIKSFFTKNESNTNNMDREEFRSALFKLGYEESSVKFDYLMKKYENYFSKNLINLHVIIQEYEMYKQKYKEEIEVPSRSGTNRDGFNTNFTSPFVDNNKDKSFKSRFEINGEKFLSLSHNENLTRMDGIQSVHPVHPVHSGISANENFLTTKYLNTGYNQGFNQTFPLDDKQLRIDSNPISFRDEENNFGIVEENLGENTINYNLTNTKNTFNYDNMILEPGIKQNFSNTSGNNRPPTLGENRMSNTGNSGMQNSSTAIKEKLKELDRKIKEDLEKNLNYIKVTIYENFQNNYKLYHKEMERDLLLLDPKREKFISQESFLEFCENYVILENYEKNILLMDLVRDATTGKYSYEDFLEKVKNFDLNEKIRQTKNFHLNYNDIIVEMRNYINQRKIDLKAVWRDLFKTSAIIDLNGFYVLIKGLNLDINLNYKNEEIEYIFSKISEDGKVSFKTFESVIKRNPPTKISMEKNETDLKESLNKAVKDNTNTMENKGNYTITSESKRPDNNSNLSQLNPDSNKNLHDYYIPVSRPIRDIKSFDEIKNKNENEVKAIIEQRIKQRDSNVLNILKYMESFKLLQLYNYISMTFKTLGSTPQVMFSMKDVKQEYYISQSDFKAVLNDLKLQITEEQKDLIIMSLPNRNNNMYLYSEFLRRIYSYNPMEYSNLIRTANLYYNDYIIELRKFIKENIIDIFAKSDFLFPKVSLLSMNQFQSLMQFISFSLSHFEECRYLFSLMSADGISLNLAAFLNILDMNPPDVEAFIEKGNLSRSRDNSNNKLLGWKYKIDNYTEEIAKNFKKNFPHLSNVFADINSMSKRNLKDVQLIDYFDDCMINPDGEIDLPIFINKLSKLGVKSGLNNLLTSFSNQKNRTFNLVKFFNAYYSFYPNEKSSMTSDINQAETSKNSFDDKNKTNNTHLNNNSKGLNNNLTAANNTGLNSPSKLNPYKKDKIVYKNFKREFSEEDIKFIQGVVSELTEIILTEKKMNVADYFKSKDANNKGYFLVEEFSNLLDKEFDFDVSEAYNELVVLFDYLINEDKIENKKVGKEHIKVNSLIEIFKDFGKEDVELKQINSAINNNTQSNTISSKEPREENILREFSRFLYNRKIKFSQIFPLIEKNPNEDYIMLIDFKNAFSLSNYPIAHDDVELLVKYFDPYNKMRISLNTIKDKIKLFVPEYFNMPFQQIDREKLVSMHSLHKQINSNPSILNLINKVNTYIDSNRLSVDELFKSFKKQHSEIVNKTEFVQNLISIDRTFSLDDLQNAFRFFDKDNQGYVSLSTFLLYFNNSLHLTHNERKDKVSISNKMIKEINSLFDFLDKDKDEKITKEEFYQALKSYNENVSSGDAELIVKAIDKEGKNYVDRKSFVNVMENHLKEQIVLHEEEKEYVIRLFKEEDIYKVGFLTPNQMRHLLLEKLKCSFEDNEIDELINEVDVNGDGMIDIDEFIKLLETEDNNDTVKHTVRQINMKRKINPMTFLSIFSGLPMNFFPSFIKDQQKLFRLLPSATLRPRKDQTGILYEDILLQSAPKIGISNTTIHNLYTLRPISTKINAKISFQTATGVCIPDDSVINRFQDIARRILKVAFFNHKDNKLFGNSVNIDARWDKDYEDRWYFDEDRKLFNNNIIVRYNGDDYEYISVIFEFVILIKKENIITETSCGWCSCELRELLRQSDMKLEIKGGSPLKNEAISKSDIRTKRSGWAKVAQFFSGQVKSQLPVTIKSCNELNNNDKMNIDYLPSCIIIHKSALNICSIYRKFIAKEILNNKFYSLKVIKCEHSIINNFCKIVDCPDSYKLMIELWNALVVETATPKDKKDDTYWENNLLDFVNKIYTVLYADRFEYTELDPTKIIVGILNQTRGDLINSSVKYGRVKKNPKAPIIPLENKSTFKPFSITELYGKRIDVMSKLDELIPIEERSLSNSVNKSDILR